MTYAIEHPGEILDFKTRGQRCTKRTELDQWSEAQPRSVEGAGHGE